MIKKLLIALVAFSFLIGNFAFADNNPPGVRDYETIIGNTTQAIDPLPTSPLKPAGVDCGWQDYTCSGVTYIGDFGYGQGVFDQMMRFSPTTNEDCYINDIGFILYDATSDVTVKVYAEDPVWDDYPDDYDMNGGVIFSIDVALADLVLYPNVQYLNTLPGWPTGGIPFNQGEDVFIAIQPKDGSGGVLTMCLEDKITDLGGSCTSDEQWRSLALWTGDVEHGFIVFSVDPLDFRNDMIFADICCEQPAYVCPGNQEWPTFQQNYGRTGYTTNTIEDLTNFRKLWEYQGDYYLVWGHPIIANEMVFVAFYDGIVALDLYTGAEVWNTFTHSDYVAFMQALSNNLRATPTVEGDRIYFGTGKATLTEGFVCADAATGDTIWVRHPNVGSVLPGGFGGLTGEVQYATSVIIDNNIYFGNSFGVFYALDKLTGADVWHVQLDQGVWFAPSTDGTDIFVGTSDGYVGAMPTIGGTLYKLDGATGAELFTWDGYDAASEGFVTAPVYDNGYLYVNGNLGIDVSGYYEGLLMKLNSADLTPAFSSWMLTMNPHFVTPNVMPFPWERITCGGSHSLYWFFPTTLANSALRQFTFAGSIAWYGQDSEIYLPAMAGPYWGMQSCSFASTCDPYLFVGSNIQGKWYVKEGLTGNNLITYQFSDEIMGTATAEYADHDYVVTTQFASGYGNGWGKVYCFDIGGPRPRLYVPSPVVTLPSVSFVDSYPQSRFADVIGNSGSADLTYTLEIQTAKAGVKGSSFTKLATELRTDMLSETMSLLDSRSLVRNTEKGSDSYDIALAADYVRFPGALTTISGSLGPGTLLNQEFVLDPDQMFRGANPFDLTIDSDDPDYNPEDASLYPHAAPQDMITIVAVKGYDFCDGYINFGVSGNFAYVANAGYSSDQGTPGDAFVVGGFTDFMYHHSFFYTYEDDHVVWDEESDNGYNHFEPNSLCLQDTVSFDMSNGSGYFSVDADRFQASFIDSLKDQATGEFDNSNTPGCEMFLKEYGGFDARFENFKFVYVEIANRGNDPLPAPLYWGTFTDWDLGAVNENIGVGMIADGLSAYRMYEAPDPALQYGIGFVPMAGNLFASNGLPTVGAYGTFQIANDPLVYDDIIVDSFFNYIDDCPAYSDCYYPGTELGVNPGQDMSALIVADKATVGGGETIKGGLVVFGFTTSTAPADEVAAVMCFANKFAGFGRADVNDDCLVNIVDLCLLNAYVNCGGQEPYPFEYLGDVDADGDIDNGDVNYLFDYLFNGGPLPKGDWVVR